MSLKLELARIQKELHAPKNQRNKFGNYNYRSCEDILEALKGVIGDCCVTASDEIVMVGDRIYVKATATVSLGDESISTTAFAREEENKKGMDASQLTGSTSSYARKYALNGLFLIDDNKDADATNDHGKSEAQQKPQKQAEKPVSKPAWDQDLVNGDVALMSFDEVGNTVINFGRNFMGHAINTVGEADLARGAKYEPKTEEEAVVVACIKRFLTGK